MKPAKNLFSASLAGGDINKALMDTIKTFLNENSEKICLFSAYFAELAGLVNIDSDTIYNGGHVITVVRIL